MEEYYYYSPFEHGMDHGRGTTYHEIVKPHFMLHRMGHADGRRASPDYDHIWAPLNLSHFLFRTKQFQDGFLVVDGRGESWETAVLYLYLQQESTGIMVECLV